MEGDKQRRDNAWLACDFFDENITTAAWYTRERDRHAAYLIKRHGQEYVDAHDMNVLHILYRQRRAEALLQERDLTRNDVQAQSDMVKLGFAEESSTWHMFGPLPSKVTRQIDALIESRARKREQEQKQLDDELLSLGTCPICRRPLICEMDDFDMECNCDTLITK